MLLLTQSKEQKRPSLCKMAEEDGGLLMCHFLIGPLKHPNNKKEQVEELWSQLKTLKFDNFMLFVKLQPTDDWLLFSFTSSEHCQSLSYKQDLWLETPRREPILLLKTTLSAADCQELLSPLTDTN